MKFFNDIHFQSKFKVATSGFLQFGRVNFSFLFKTLGFILPIGLAWINTDLIEKSTIPMRFKKRIKYVIIFKTIVYLFL